MSRVSAGQLGNTGAPSAQVVEQEQPGPGLGGDDADAGVGAGAGAGGRQRPDGVDELALVVDENRSGLGSAARVVRQEVASAPVWERGEGADVVPADDERDDGLPGRSRRRTASTSRGPSATDSTCSATALVWRVGGEVVEDVRCGDVDGVPDARRRG